MGFKNSITEYEALQACDEERGIIFYDVFVPLDVQSPPQHFILDWHDHKIVVKAYNKASLDGVETQDNQRTFDWDVIGVWVPESFPKTHESIATVILEALECFCAQARSLEITIRPDAFRVKDRWEEDTEWWLY